MELKAWAKKWKADIPAVYLVLKDRETPVLAKVLAGITAAYALSPVDLIPDFIPVFGYLDDVILLPVLIALTARAVPKELWEKNRRAAEGLRKDGKPVKWYCAIPIVVLWLWIIGAVIRAVWA